METKKSVFETLNAVNVNEHTEKKNGLTYLSWAWAWGTLKKYYPLATYKVYETENGMNYFNDGHTAWVKTGVTVEDIEYIEYLPIMDYKNNSIPLEKVTSFDVNKAIQRSLTKCVARHGLGLYVYANEDLPEDQSKIMKQKPTTEPAKPEKLSLTSLIKGVGDRVRTMKAKDGNTDAYQAVLTKVATPDFKCNAATEKDYAVVQNILDELIRMGY